eukprot:m.293246 g.293246  ORF g.293246 m.293246 type:complete len:833 (+) comp19620_c0_seq1:234-2732(+)
MMGTVAAMQLDGQGPRLMQKSAHCCAQFPTKIVLLLAVGFLYLFIGGAVMSELEAGEERQAERRYLQAVSTGFAQAGLNSSQQAAIFNMLDTLDELRSSVGNMGHQDWSFVGATYYSLTAVTTIGYGWLAPKTQAGQIFTVVYSIIGIPLVFYMFAYLGRKLMDVIGFRISSLREGKEFKRKQLQDESVFVPMLVALIIATVLICATAAIYTSTEGWDYWEAVYFIFITMTTIGFGDFVPEFDDRWWPLLLSLFGVFIMLSVYSYLLNVAIVLFTNLIGRLARAGIGAMDVEGSGHVGILDFLAYIRGRTEAHREAYQSKLVVRLLQHDLSLLQKAELIGVWGTFCINTTTRQYRLPRNLTIMALVGGPGAGKTHMAKYLAQHNRITRVAVEELILDEVVHKTKLGVAITSALKAGLVLPDGLIVSLLRKRLSRAMADDIILLDGFPSSASLVEAIDQNVKLIERFILLDCADETLQARFKLFNVSDTVKGLLSHTSVSTRSHTTLHHMRDDQDSGTSSGSQNSLDSSPERRTETAIEVHPPVGVFTSQTSVSGLSPPDVTVADADMELDQDVKHFHQNPNRVSASLHEASMPPIPRRTRRTKSVDAADTLRPGVQTLNKHFDVLEGAIEASSSRRGFFSRTKSPIDGHSWTSNTDVTYYSPQDQLEVFEDSLDNFKADRAGLVELVLDRLFVIDAEGVLEDVERQIIQAFNSRQDNSVPEEFAVSGGYVFRHHPKVGVPYRRIPSSKASRRRQRTASVRSLPDELDTSLTPERSGSNATDLRRFSSAKVRHSGDSASQAMMAMLEPTLPEAGSSLTRSAPNLKGGDVPLAL